MPEMIIGRKPTEEELRNYIPVGFETLEKRFKKKRIEIEQQYVKKHKPYCGRCADLDFTDLWESKKKEVERKVGSELGSDTRKIEFNFPDLEKYGNEDRFELKKKSPIITDVIIDGTKVPKLKGHYYEYVCKIRGCGRAVEVPLQDLTQEPELKPETKKQNA